MWRFSLSVISFTKRTDKQRLQRVSPISVPSYRACLMPPFSSFFRLILAFLFLCILCIYLFFISEPERGPKGRCQTAIAPFNTIPLHSVTGLLIRTSLHILNLLSHQIVEKDHWSLLMVELSENTAGRNQWRATSSCTSVMQLITHTSTYGVYFFSV